MRRPSWTAGASQLQSLIGLGAMVVALSLSSDAFLTVDNLTNVLRQIAVNLCLSMGMTLVILSGGIDLSVGSNLALSGAVAAGLLKHGVMLERFGVMLQFTPLGALVAGVLTGVAIGLANGLLVTRLRLPPFVATLGMLSVARGLTMLWTGGFPINDLGAEFGYIGSDRLFGLPVTVLIACSMAFVLTLVTKRTRFGRALYAVGGNERAATLSGLNVDRTKMIAYALCGGLAGVAGLITTARLDAATPDAGVGYELDSIAAAVIGGTSLSGGRGTIFGALLGCLIIGVLNNGLVLLEVSPYWQQVTKGAVILFAVAVDRTARRYN